MAKNKKKKKSHNRFNIIYIVIAIVIILITGISCFCIINNKKDMELSYNQFVGYMKNNEVKSVKYSQEKEYIVGELSNGKTFKVENPQTDDFKKEMLEYCYKRMNNEFPSITIHQVKRWLAWLEKQGEQKPAWSEEDEYVYNEILKRVDDKKLYEHDLEYIYKWLKLLKSQNTVIWQKGN